MKLSDQQLQDFVRTSALGMAKMQARQEMLECIVRAFIVETPPIAPLAWQALHTARSDWEQRSRRARPYNPPEIDAAALALWNELTSVCAPPASSGTSIRKPGGSE